MKGHRSTQATGHSQRQGKLTRVSSSNNTRPNDNIMNDNDK